MVRPPSLVEVFALPEKSTGSPHPDTEAAINAAEIPIA
jgi:hypothetical protein